MIPLSLYIAMAVRRDLLVRYPKRKTISAFVGPFAMLMTWLAMSYFLADSLLDSIAESHTSRLSIGRIWVRCVFFGLVTLALLSVVINKFNSRKNR